MNKYIFATISLACINTLYSMEQSDLTINQVITQLQANSAQPHQFCSSDRNQCHQFCSSGNKHLTSTTPPGDDSRDNFSEDDFIEQATKDLHAETCKYLQSHIHQLPRKTGQQLKSMLDRHKQESLSSFSNEDITIMNECIRMRKLLNTDSYKILKRKF